jgi:hypothetical protein
MTVKILENADNGTLALQESTLTDGSRVYSVFVRGAELPCRNKETATGLFLKLVEMVYDFDII